MYTISVNKSSQNCDSFHPKQLNSYFTVDDIFTLIFIQKRTLIKFQIGFVQCGPVTVRPE